MASRRDMAAEAPLRGGRFSLHRQLWLVIAIVVACSLALGGGLILRYHQNLAETRDNLHALAAFRLTLDAVNRISAERGPSNRALGEGPAVSAPSREFLQQARAATDAALAQLAATAAFGDGVPHARETLARARQQVDALAALPLAERGTSEIAAAVDAMFGAYDAARPLVDRGVALLSAGHGDLLGEALVMRMLSGLRDQAGRLGSYLVVPMIHREPMAADRRTAFDEAEGRVQQLWWLVGTLAEVDSDPGVARAQRAVAERFLGEGLPLLQRILGESATGEYSMTATELTAAVVPSFAPLEELRDAFANATTARLHADAAEAQGALVSVAALTGVALAFELLLLLAGHKWLFGPLLRARTRVVELADGRLDEPVEPGRLRGEMQELYEAIATLRIRLIERAALTERFRRQAETDGLTGALNRRALEEFAAGLAGAGARQVGLIMLDIDHFKRVNDTYGHAEGDTVLKEAVRRVGAQLREHDILARFGGEEFAVVVTD